MGDYGHLFDEFDPAERVSPEQVIREARGVLFPASHLRDARA
jgi:hypothetical protein